MKCCSPALSPSLRIEFMAFSYCRSQVAALLGSVSTVLSERGWVAFMTLRRKLKCVAGSPNASSRIGQASSTEASMSFPYLVSMSRRLLFASNVTLLRCVSGSPYASSRID